MLKDKWWLVAVFLTILYFFGGVSFNNLDPDLGWHLRTGADFLEKGIFPGYDRYSFALPAFAWPDYEFGLEVGMYLLYKYLGYFGLGLTFALISAFFLTLHFYLIKRYFSVKPLTIFLFGAIFLLGFSTSTAIRAPVVAVWGNILLFWLIYDYLHDFVILKRRWLWALAVGGLFLLWANTHPSFFLGIFILALTVGYKILKFKKLDWFGLSVLLLAAGATLLNPYNLRVWQEIFVYFNPVWGIYNKNNIKEWAYLFTFPLNIPAIAPFLFCFTELIDNRKYLFSTHRFLFIVSLLSLVSAFSAIRNIALLLVWAPPLVLAALDRHINTLPKINPLMKRLVFGFLLISLLVLTIGLYAANMGKNTLEFNPPPAGFPSRELVAKIRTQDIKDKKLFNLYDWGGFLIWHFGGDPKVFIDGRMPATWHDEHTFPFKDYVEMKDDETKDQVFKKYSFNMALVKKQEWRPLNFINRFIIGGEKEEKSMAVQVEEASVRTWLRKQTAWKQVYSDDSAEVYAKD